MIKSELIQKISDENPHLFQRDVERLVDTIFSEITVALSEGRRAELRGFGAFSVKHRKPRLGRNPRTGVSVKVQDLAPNVPIRLNTTHERLITQANIQTLRNLGFKPKYNIEKFLTNKNLGTII